MTASAAIIEPAGMSWFAQFFNVKPAVGLNRISSESLTLNIFDVQAYVFRSQDTCDTALIECARILRSFGVLVDEANTSKTTGLLRCHVNYMRGKSEWQR